MEMYLFIHDYFSLGVGEYWILRIWFLNYTSKAISLKRHAEFEEFHTHAGEGVSRVYTMSLRKSLTTRWGTLHLVAMWASLRFVLLEKKKGYDDTQNFQMIVSVKCLWMKAKLPIESGNYYQEVSFVWLRHVLVMLVLYTSSRKTNNRHDKRIK